MRKINLYSNLLISRLYRLLYLLFIAVLAVYPFLDAYSNLHDFSPPSINDMDDDYGDDNHVQVIKHASQGCHAACIAFSHRTASTDILGFPTYGTTIATIVKTSRSSLPLSSDPSPPVI